MDSLGRAAVHAARALAGASTATKNSALAASAAADSQAERRDPRSQSQRFAGGGAARAFAGDDGSAGARRETRCGDGERHRRRRGAGRSCRRRHRSLDATQRAAHRARAGAARRDRHRLRKPPERDCGRRCAVLEIGQRGDSARRLREHAVEPCNSCMPGRGAARCRVARGRDPDRADDGSSSGGPHALRHDGLDRRARAARRTQPRRARAEGSARAGDRPPRGQLPRLRRSRCRPGHGARDRAERQAAADRRMRRG